MTYAGAKLAEYYEQIMAEELNVKEIRWIENLDEHLADYGPAPGIRLTRTAESRGSH